MWLQRASWFSVFVCISAIALSFLVPERQDTSVLSLILNTARSSGLAITSAVLGTLAQRYGSTKLNAINGTLDISGLHHSVEVHRDQYGIPHIYGSDRHDLLFAQGFVHAQDRLWQMEIFRRLATGRLSELVGELALPTDRLVRTMGFSRRAEQDLKEGKMIDKPSLDLMQSYLDGINGYLDSAWFQAPIEFSVVGGGDRIQKWTMIEYLSFQRCLSWQMSKGWGHEVTRQALMDAVGIEMAAELDPDFMESMPIHVKNGIEVNGLMDKVATFFTVDGGSNAWVVSGNRTLSGKPILSNDIHLALTVPSIWYENHLCGAGWNVSGATIPGAGFVVCGHNERVAWGITLANVDVDDLFMEKFMDDGTYEHMGQMKKPVVHEETIIVKGRTTPFVEHVVETVHGPLVSNALDFIKGNVSLSSLSIKSPPSLQAFTGIMGASDWKSFSRSVKQLFGISLNLVYSDVDGNIGHRVSGLVPIRAEGHLGDRPVPGWTGQYDWKDWIPVDEMPHQLNPSQGYLVSANHPLAPPYYKWYLGRSFSNAWRAQRLDEVIKNKPLWSLEDSRLLQMDVTSIPGRLFRKKVINMTLPNDPDISIAVSLLENWDAKVGKESIGGTIYNVAKKFCLHNILEPHLGEELTLHALGKGFHPVFRAATEYVGFDSSMLLKFLDNPDSLWMKNFKDKEEMMAKSLKDTVTWLKYTIGEDISMWKWGSLHKITWKHTLGSRAPLDLVFNKGPFPDSGDSDTPKLSILFPGSYAGTGFNPTFKQIVDLSDMSTTTINAPGQSGQIGSNHFDDFLSMWINGELHPSSTLAKEGLKNVEGVLYLNPKK